LGGEVVEVDRVGVREIETSWSWVIISDAQRYSASGETCQSHKRDDKSRENHDRLSKMEFVSKLWSWLSCSALPLNELNAIFQVTQAAAYDGHYIYRYQNGLKSYHFYD
jgi:hypothetical protein